MGADASAEFGGSTFTDMASLYFFLDHTFSKGSQFHGKHVWDLRYPPCNCPCTGGDCAVPEDDGEWVSGEWIANDGATNSTMEWDGTDSTVTDETIDLSQLPGAGR